MKTKFQIGDVIEARIIYSETCEEIITGTITDIKPTMIIAMPNGMTRIIYQEIDSIKRLSKGEAMLWKLENA
jgi:ferredoxin-fold anticodon binding domain-containing protein